MWAYWNQCAHLKCAVHIQRSFHNWNDTKAWANQSLDWKLFKLNEPVSEGGKIWKSKGWPSLFSISLVYYVWKVKLKGSFLLFWIVQNVILGYFWFIYSSPGKWWLCLSSSIIWGVDFGSEKIIFERVKNLYWITGCIIWHLYAQSLKNQAMGFLMSYNSIFSYIMPPNFNSCLLT